MSTNSNPLGGNYEATPEQVARMIRASTMMGKHGRPLFVWGPPGIGKSSVAEQVAADLGFKYIDIRALLLDPVDLRGIPYRDSDNRTRWAPPIFFPDGRDAAERYLLNLDELAAAPPLTQAGLYQLLWDRKLGEYDLPPGCTMMATSNRLKDSGIVHKPSTALASRFMHVTMKTDPNMWSAWAASHEICTEVLFYIKFRPDRLHQFNPKTMGEELAFPSPRTWEFASDILKVRTELSHDEMRMLLVGAVGQAAAVDFAGFLRYWKQLPHPDTIFRNPGGCPIPQDQGVLIALAGSLYNHVEDDTMGALCRFAKRLKPELGEFLVDMTVRGKPELQHTRAYIKHAAEAATR